MDKAKSFYDKVYKEKKYAAAYQAETHSNFKSLKAFVEKYSLKNKKCLEVGCGRGAFQNLVEYYTGLDLSSSVKPYLGKPFVQSLATSLPFSDNQFDALWSIYTLEHVSDPEQTISEMSRTLKPGGLLYLAPAWQCRSWASKDYAVSPYSDLNLRGKILKVSLLFRNSVWYRSICIFPKRLLRLISFLIDSKTTSLRYVKLKPDYEKYLMIDSDACCSIDPYEAIMWFRSRGHECLSYTTWLSQFFVRTGPIIFRINKPEGVGVCYEA